jgi:hypothetical protein
MPKRRLNNLRHDFRSLEIISKHNITGHDRLYRSLGFGASSLLV